MGKEGYIALMVIGLVIVGNCVFMFFWFSMMSSIADGGSFLTGFLVLSILGVIIGIVMLIIGIIKYFGTEEEPSHRYVYPDQWQRGYEKPLPPP